MAALPPAVPAIEFSLASTGMSKGIAQTTGPQFVGRAELGLRPFFVGAYAKNVDSSTSDGEAGPVIGVRTKSAGLDLGLSATWKWAINAAPKSDPSALELNATAARKIGRLSPRLSLVWSHNDVGMTKSTLFAEAGSGYRLTRLLSASAAVGRRERSGGPDYTAWNAGLTWNVVKPLSIDLRYYDTDGGNTQPYRARAVVSARAKF